MQKIYFPIAIIGILLIAGCDNTKKSDHGDHTHGHHEAMEKNNIHDRPESTGEEKSVMHKQHNNLKDNFAHKEITLLASPYKPGELTGKVLKKVVESYLALKNAFVNGDPVAGGRAAEVMKQRVNEVDTKFLSGKAKQAWEQHASLYNQNLQELLHINGLEHKRSYFSHITEIVYCTVKSFDIKNDMTLYAVYCPMAFDNKGAYWLAESMEIKNPYFGKKMLDCGKVEEIL